MWPRALSCVLLAPQRPLLLDYFWTFSHHNGLWLMFGITMRKRAPSGIFQTFSLANSGPYILSLQSEKHFLWDFSEITPLLNTLCISLQWGHCGLIPSILYQFRLKCFVFGCIRCFAFGFVFLEVCGVRLGKFPRFLLGWCFLGVSCLIHSSQCWKDIFVNLPIHHCLSWMPQKHF